MQRGVHIAAVLVIATHAWAATRVVHVGQGGLFFVDEVSGNSTTSIAPGDTVEWQWEAPLAHSSTRATAPETWDAGVHTAPFMFSRTFTTPGTFDYFCTPHRQAGMTGTVVVGGGATTTTLPVSGADAQFAALGARLAVLQTDLDAGVTKSKKAFDKLVVRALQDTQTARTLAAAGQGRQAKGALKHAIRTLTTLRFRIGSNTGRSRIPDQSVRTKLLGDVKQLRTDMQSLQKSL